jgi:hypothetical protein
MLRKYIIFASAHGAARSLLYTHGAVIVKDNKQDIHRPILITERVQLALLNACVNIPTCPFTLFDDIGALEAYLRGIKTHKTPSMFPSTKIKFAE